MSDSSCRPALPLPDQMHATRGAPRPAPFNPATGSVPAQVIEPQTIVLRKDRAPNWPHDLPDPPIDLSMESYGPAIARRLATFCDEVSSTYPFTATELQTFANCPRRYQWHHHLGASFGRLITVMPDDLERYRVNESRGRIIHLYLERHEHGWGEGKMRQVMRDSIARSVDYPLEKPEQYVDEFLPDVHRFLTSEQYELLRAADEVHRERAIHVHIPGQPGCEVEAKPDVMFRHNRRWYVIDFKTANFSGSPSPLSALLEDTLRYELQAALYLIALQSWVGKHAVDSFTFFYTAHGVAVQETPSDVWLDGWRAMVPSISRLIQKKAFGPLDPQWSRSKCSGCTIRDTVCKPVGDPDGTPRPISRR